MKTIGLIGGMSWESTSVYYSYINRFVQGKLGGLHSAKCLLYSFDFEEIAVLQRTGEWDEAKEKMVTAAKTLEHGGSDVLVICTNTMHIVADEIEKACSIPLLHIVECVVEEIVNKKISKVGLIGTKFTMERPLYREFLNKNDIDMIVPDEEDRRLIHDVIFNELCKGEIKAESKEAYIDIVNKLVEKGAEGIILGCTEIPLLLNQKDTRIPLFDTTYIHAKKVVEFALMDA